MKNLFRSFVLLVILIVLGAQVAAQETLEVRIGYQRGSLLNVPEVRDSLETSLEEKTGQDVTVTLTLFSAGPPLLEALNAGSIDFGSTGDTPPIFAQAAGVPLVYVASQINYGGSAILVPADSDIQTLEDLAGKTIAFTSGSSAHYLTIRALETVGLTLNDVTPAYLSPGDARAAFDGGSIDAWTIWDPFWTIAADASDVRVLLRSSELPPTFSYHLAARDFAENHPDALLGILEVFQAAIDWARADIEAFAAYLEAETEVPADVWVGIYTQRPLNDIQFLYDSIVESQQAVADVFFEQGILPQAIVIRDAVWLPEGFDPTANRPESTPEPEATQEGS